MRTVLQRTREWARETEATSKTCRISAKIEISTGGRRAFPLVNPEKKTHHECFFFASKVLKHYIRDIL